MKANLSLWLLLLFIGGCSRSDKSIAVWIENNSDINESFEFVSYFGDSVVDRRSIEKDSIADRVRSFRLLLPKEKQIVFAVKTPNGKETSCIILLDSVTEKSLLHVHFVERVVKKEKTLDNIVLTKDSIFRNDFYCELLYKFEY